MSDPVDGGLTVEEADVVVSGSSDGEALSTVPNNVLLVGRETLAEELGLLGRRGENHMLMSTGDMTHLIKLGRRDENME